MSHHHILIIDDEESIRFTFDVFLKREGYNVTTAATAQEALKQLDFYSFDLIFSDILLGESTGIDLLREIKKRQISAPVILITGAPEIDTATEALRLGAYDYIPKPINRDMVLRVARMALSFGNIQRKKEEYQLNLEAIFNSVRDGIITVDDQMRILSSNRRAEEICGITQENLGKSLQDCCCSQKNPCLTVLKQSLHSHTVAESARQLCPQPERGDKMLALSASPLIDSQQRTIGAVLVVRDETKIEELERNLRQRNTYQRCVGQNQQMQEIYDHIEALSDVDTTVLISGDSGTGKELIAEALHFSGNRKEKPLVKVNCAALPENLLESELFGHVRGAFTGATANKIGRFEKADGGTIFLDEIGDISPALQVRLLRVLQEKEFERVGDVNPRRVDVRILAATHQDLRDKVKNGSFREDLYYRLKVVNLTIPALRERRDDIPLLTEHFIAQFNQKFKKSVRGVEDDVLSLFMNYSWPGNIRELEHVIEHAFILCRDEVLTIGHLPQEFQERASAPSRLVAQDENEQEQIRQAMIRCGGNKAKAARLLGISRQTLYRKLEESPLDLDELP